MDHRGKRHSLWESMQRQEIRVGNGNSKQLRRLISGNACSKSGTKPRFTPGPRSRCLDFSVARPLERGVLQAWVHCLENAGSRHRTPQRPIFPCVLPNFLAVLFRNNPMNPRRASQHGLFLEAPACGIALAQRFPVTQRKRPPQPTFKFSPKAQDRRQPGSLGLLGARIALP